RERRHAAVRLAPGLGIHARPAGTRRSRRAGVSGPLLWDVDTQVDFVRTGAKLPVPDAEAALPAMARLVRWAAEHDVTHLANVDDHELTDPDLSEDTPSDTTYRPHVL